MSGLTSEEREQLRSVRWESAADLDAAVEAIVAARLADAEARAEAVEATVPTLPFTVRVPLDRNRDNDGQRPNVGERHVEVRVILDPEMEKLGECRWDVPTYTGNAPTIALREWNEQVFLHELLHVATGHSAWWSDPQRQINDPEGHDVISRIEVALWETGWRQALRGDS